MSKIAGHFLLVVEDDPQEVAHIRRLLENLEVKSRIVETVEEAREALVSQAFDLLLTDLHIQTRAGFENPDGLSVIAFAREQQPNLVIVANSTDPRTDVWDQALAAGAQHFIRKPLTKVDELVIAFQLAKERKTFIASKQARSKRQQAAQIYQQLLAPYPHGLVIEKSDLQKALGLVRRTRVPAVLMGETGTGKEEFARLVHKLRVQAEGEIPFVAVNCSTIPQHLAESLLFGHKKGSFTGADTTTTGYIAEADGGILFLDEIHTLDMKIQQKLLRVLNDGTFHRLGETRTYVSRFQLISATTVDLDDEAEAGRFLLDLRGRVSGIDIFIKPLRARKEQIPPLVALFLQRNDIDLEPDLFELLCQKLSCFYWRTNIRQLYKVLEAWVIRCDFDELPLHPDHLPYVKGMTAPDHKESIDPNASELNQELILRSKAFLIKALSEDLPLEESLAHFERAILEAAISRHKTIGAAADALSLARSTLDGRRKKLGLS